MKFTSAEKPTGSSRTGLKSKAHLLKKVNTNNYINSSQLTKGIFPGHLSLLPPTTWDLPAPVSFDPQSTQRTGRTC